MTNAALEKRGVDISKVEYIEVPLPQAVAALEARRVDAAYVPDPFSTLGLQAGHRSIGQPVVEIARDYILAAYFTTDEYIADHKEIVDRFVGAGALGQHACPAPLGEAQRSAKGLTRLRAASCVADGGAEATSRPSSNAEQSEEWGCRPFRRPRTGKADA